MHFFNVDENNSPTFCIQKHFQMDEVLPRDLLVVAKAPWCWMTFAMPTMHPFATPPVIVDRSRNGFLLDIVKKSFCIPEQNSWQLVFLLIPKRILSRSFGGGGASISYDLFGKYFTSYVGRRLQRISCYIPIGTLSHV